MMNYAVISGLVPGTQFSASGLPMGGRDKPGHDELI